MKALRFQCAGTLAFLVAAVLFCCPFARADVFGPITLVSSGNLTGSEYLQQAELAGDAVISQDGRYVAFDGSFGGRSGIFRRDRGSDEVAMVAEGDATLPSISQDGRYVSFTTTTRLDEQNDTNKAPDVYVRDMSVPLSGRCPVGWEEAGERCPYAIASAVDGSARGLTYEYPRALYASELPFNETHFGSFASGRSALSADGREVAFITTAVSDLAGVEAPPLPRLQVLVRHLDSRHTELLSTTYREGVQTSEPVAGEAGAVFAGSTRDPLPFPEHFGGASISADGSTVAWMGAALGAQAPFLEGEGVGEGYTEPLWRKVGDPGARTRRITGGSDPLAPACASSGERTPTEPPTLSDPCQGPFETTGGKAGVAGLWTAGTEWNYVPQLSADGETVAFLATARYIASGSELRSAEFSDDLYVADMREGRTRVQALSRITELAGGGANDPARTGPIMDLGISPDGRQIAFASGRSIFPLGSPAFVSPLAAGGGFPQLYDADLASDTLTRVTVGYEGRRPEGAGRGSTGSPSFSFDGSTLAFASIDSNLIYGDGNGALDAFIVPRLSFPSLPTPQETSLAPANPSPSPRWTLSATTISRRNGTVLVYVQVPAAGSLQAVASGNVPVSGTGSSARSGRAPHRRAKRTLKSTNVSARSAKAGAAGLLIVPLTLHGPYAYLAGVPHGLYANVRLAFSAPGRAALRASLNVVFQKLPGHHARRLSRKRGVPR